MIHYLYQTALFLALISLTYSGTATVMIVRSSDNAAYRKAADTSEQTLRSNSISVEGVLLGELSVSRLTESEKNPESHFLAVGSAARTWLHQTLSPGAKVTFCMVATDEVPSHAETHVVSGITTAIPISEQMKLLESVLPETASIGALYNASDPASATGLEAFRAALPSNWSLVALDVTAKKSIASAIKLLCRADIDIIWTTADSAVYDAAVVRSLLLSSLRRRLPVLGFSIPFVRSGALLGLSVDPAAQGRWAAESILREITQGRLSDAVADSPLSPPAPLVTVNLHVAEKLKLKLPEDLVERAQVVYGTDSSSK